MTAVTVTRASDAQVTLPVIEELNRRLDEVRQRAFDLFAARGFQPGRELDDWFTAEQQVRDWPAGEMWETDEEYEMDLSLPGFSAKDVEVTALPDAIVVRAATTETSKGEADRLVWSEFGRRNVCRQVTFPTPVDYQGVTAELANGVLKVHAPKAGAVEPAGTPVPITAP